MLTNGTSKTIYQSRFIAMWSILVFNGTCCTVIQVKPQNYLLCNLLIDERTACPHSSTLWENTSIKQDDLLGWEDEPGSRPAKARRTLQRSSTYKMSSGLQRFISFSCSAYDSAYSVRKQPESWGFKVFVSHWLAAQALFVGFLASGLVARRLFVLLSKGFSLDTPIN